MPNYAAQESPEEREECDTTGENHASAEDSGIQSSKFLTTKVVLTVSNQPGFSQVPIKTKQKRSDKCHFGSDDKPCLCWR